MRPGGGGRAEEGGSERGVIVEVKEGNGKNVKNWNPDRVKEKRCLKDIRGWKRGLFHLPVTEGRETRWSRPNDRRGSTVPVKKNRTTPVLRLTKHPGR